MKTNDYPIGLNINFDSLSYAFGYPQGYRDPCYFEIMDRFLALAQKYDARYTFYLIGRDLQCKEVAARIRDLSEQGHEIANHTWSHDMSFGAMPPEKIEEEILRSHEIILKTTGREPKGFTAPGWTTSPAVYKTLIKNGYTHDASSFPTPLLYAVIGKIAWNKRAQKGVSRKVLSRRDWLDPLRRPLDPYYVDERGRTLRTPETKSLLVLPMPTMHRFGKALWHTSGYAFGWKKAKRLLKTMLEKKNGLYYLMHPGDLIGYDDVEDGSTPNFERMQFTANDKRQRVGEMLSACAQSDRRFSTMSELADCFRRENR